MDTSSKQKSKKETVILIDITQAGLTRYLWDIQPQTPECTFFLSAYEISARIDHMICHKNSQQI